MSSAHRSEEARTGPESDADTRSTAGAFGASVPETDQTRPGLAALRDGSVAVALLSLFGGAEAWSESSGLALPAVVSTLAGFLVGAASTALAHEWGHFLGARMGGGHAPLGPIGRPLPLFDYDFLRNDGRAFLWMSVGGNVAHWSAFAIYLVALSTHSPGQTALVAGAFGFAVFSSAIEFPVIQRAREGMDARTALGTIPRDFVRRYLPWALGSALVAFLVL